MGAESVIEPLKCRHVPCSGDALSDNYFVGSPFPLILRWYLFIKGCGIKINFIQKAAGCI